VPGISELKLSIYKSIGYQTFIYNWDNYLPKTRTLTFCFEDEDSFSSNDIASLL
jgi:hypothetical protein